MQSLGQFRGRLLRSVAARTLTSAKVTPPSRPDITVPWCVHGPEISVTVPLPGKLGLTKVAVPADASVKSFVEQLKSLDGSVDRVEVTSNGQRVAKSTAIGLLTDGEINIKLGDTVVHVTAREGSAALDEPLKAAKYARLKEEVLKSTQPTMTIEAFNDLCAKMGGDRTLARRWLECLVSQGGAALVQGGKAIIVNPTSKNFRQQVSEVLRRDDELLNEKVAALTLELQALEKSEAKMRGTADDIVKRARRKARVKGTGILSLALAQYAGLGYFVYELYSWDVMEPACYFLLLTYSVGGAIYFSVKKRDATYDNLLKQSVMNAEKSLHMKLGYDVLKHKKIQEDLSSVRDALGVLQSRITGTGGKGVLS